MPAIGELVAVWLSCAVHFGLSTRREPFIPHDDLQDVVQDLLRSGYCWRKRDGRIVWIDKDRTRDAVGPFLGCPADGHGRIDRAESFIELAVQTLQRRGRMMFDVTPAKPRD